ncbi:hypothetical protein GSI_03114 [Ganoderma sinense ZZ0214-1]|uniref:Uncharacterized protein n=1 Tax=Ganoderma sinense ZZ0214-1 TaxID=1077348 RepID=A0A2G8SKP5_9APHY|nr:hypothetical protein GSI_03114 [Ganoderma sinense ZZ0214-1]
MSRHVRGLKQAAEENEKAGRELAEEIHSLEKKIVVQRVHMAAHHSNLKEVLGDTEKLEDRVAATYASCRKEAKAIEALRLAVLEVESRRTAPVAHLFALHELNFVGAPRTRIALRWILPTEYTVYSPETSSGTKPHPQQSKRHRQ